jgi:hypothetical protein
MNGGTGRSGADSGSAATALRPRSQRSHGDEGDQIHKAEEGRHLIRPRESLVFSNPWLNWAGAQPFATLTPFQKATRPRISAAAGFGSG